MTSQKWNLRFQIGQVFQFCIHRISAKYHILRLHTFEGETFGSFDVLIGHRGVTWLVTMETLSPKYFWNQVLLLLSVSFISYSPKNSKHFCAYHAPTEWVGRSYWKKPLRDWQNFVNLQQCSMFLNQGVTLILCFVDRIITYKNKNLIWCDLAPIKTSSSLFVLKYIGRSQNKWWASVIASVTCKPQVAQAGLRRRAWLSMPPVTLHVTLARSQKLTCDRFDLLGVLPSQIFEQKRDYSRVKTLTYSNMTTNYGTCACSWSNKADQLDFM